MVIKSTTRIIWRKEEGAPSFKSRVAHQFQINKNTEFIFTDDENRKIQRIRADRTTLHVQVTGKQREKARENKKKTRARLKEHQKLRSEKSNKKEEQYGSFINGEVRIVEKVCGPNERDAGPEAPYHRGRYCLNIARCNNEQ
ncbi:uncharacterized protein LOC135693839 [Rhopilema esculentum]|uniref:uncharacterized protein LOC135693839 n=1 Tax=Rhopilema esculentum TaxID=499914 RepID=UPI0031E464C3